MYDAEGQELAAGDVVLFIHRTAQYPTRVQLEHGIIEHIDTGIAYIRDMTLTYERRMRSEEIVLRTSAYRGQNLTLITALYNTNEN